MDKDTEREILNRKSSADRVLEKTAIEMESLLKEACLALRPFPSFPNAFFTNAIECDPNGLIGNDGNGCVVVTENGELHELDFGVDHDAIEMLGSWDPVSARKETLRPLELHPRDYLLFAYSGLVAVTEALLEQNSPPVTSPAQENLSGDYSTSQPGIQSADSLVEEGNVYFTVSQYNLAIDRYTSALEQEPRQISALYNRGRANSHIGALQDALRDYHQVLDLVPDDLDTLNNRGLLYLEDGKLDEALADFEKALALNTTDTTLLVNKGLVLLAKEDPLQSLNSFKAAVAQDPVDPAAHYAIAKAFMALGNRTETLQALQTAFRLDDSYIEAAFNDSAISQLSNEPDFLEIIKELGLNFPTTGDGK